MRVPLESLVLAWALAASGCLVSDNLAPGRPCSEDTDCPEAYRCVASSEGQGTCEVQYPPRPQNTDAGTPDAGPVPTWCQDIRPILAASCVGSCHGATTSGSGRADFRLDLYAQDGGVLGAREMASRIKARAVEQRNMPPPGNPAPSAAERDLLSRWVLGGAPGCADGGTQ